MLDVEAAELAEAETRRFAALELRALTEQSKLASEQSREAEVNLASLRSECAQLSERNNQALARVRARSPPRPPLLLPAL